MRPDLEAYAEGLSRAEQAAAHGLSSFRINIALLRAMKVTCDDLEIKRREGKVKSAVSKQLLQCRQLLHAAIKAKAITASDYLTWVDGNGTNLPAYERAYVVCTRDEARQILERGPPRRCLLILADDNGVIGTTNYEKRLEEREQVEVQRYRYVMFGDDDDQKPLTMTGREAVEALKDPLNPVKMRGLGPEPDARASPHAGLKDWTLLQDSGCLAGQDDDGSDPTAFTMLASRHTFSGPRVDGCAVVTSVTNEGRPGAIQLCMIYPPLAPGELQVWQDSADRKLEKPFHAIHLRAGETLVRPPTTVYFYYNMGAGLTTCTKAWHTSSMLDVARQAQLERRYADVAAESEPVNLIEGLLRIVDWWGRRDERYQFGSDSDLTRFRDRIKVRDDPKLIKGNTDRSNRLYKSEWAGAAAT